MRRVILIILIGAIAAGTIFTYTILSSSLNQSGKIEPPQQIGPYELVSHITGESARRQIEKMHFGYPGDIIDATVAVYERDDGTLLHLWISRFSSPEEAEKNIEAMASKMMKEPELGFRPVQRTVEGHKVYLAVKGGIHAFWSQGPDTYYILIPTIDEKEALDIVNILIKGGA